MIKASCRSEVEQVAISLDDLVAEKTGGPSFGISNKTNTHGCDDLEGNQQYLFLLCLLFMYLCFPFISCFLFHWLF